MKKNKGANYKNYKNLKPALLSLCGVFALGASLSLAQGNADEITPEKIAAFKTQLAEWDQKVMLIEMTKDECVTEEYNGGGAPSFGAIAECIEAASDEYTALNKEILAHEAVTRHSGQTYNRLKLAEIQNSTQRSKSQGLVQGIKEVVEGLE